MQEKSTKVIDMTQKDSLIECPICMTENTKMVTFPCKHSCCHNCWKGIIKAANSNFQIKEVKCFVWDCKKLITNCNTLVSQMSDKDISSRYHYLKKKQKIMSDKNKFICINRQCNKILDLRTQKKVQKNYLKKDSGKMHQKKQKKDIKNLDFSFLICDDCDTVFCKICEVFHEPGKAACRQRKLLPSETIIKVINVISFPFDVFKLTQNRTTETAKDARSAR